MLVGVDVNAVALVLWIEGSLGCVLIASWYGENPWMLVNEFLAFTDQRTANSRSQLFSSKILSSISGSMRLCRSTSPLLHGASVLNVLMVMPRLSQSCVNSVLANSLPLSVKNICAKP